MYTSHTIRNLKLKVTLSVPIELTLRGESPYISEAIVFGAGRTQIGAIIILTELITTKSHTRKQIIDLIDPAVKLANHSAPSHSQLTRETFVFFDFGTPIPRADKGSFLRPKVYVALAKIIDQVYASLEGDADDGDKTKLTSVEQAIAVVFSALSETVGEQAQGLKEDSDLFEHGFDSLQSTRVRNSLQRVCLHSSSPSFIC